MPVGLNPQASGLHRKGIVQAEGFCWRTATNGMTDDESALGIPYKVTLPWQAVRGGRICRARA